MLVGRNISKSMGGRKILSDVSISLEKGEIVALVGPSGGGKSTLLRNLSLLEKPDSGSICLDNITFNFPSKEKFVPSLIHPAISLVFQQFHLWPHLKIRDNLLMPIKEQKLNLDKDIFNNWGEYFEISTLMDRYPHQLSVGQKQRVAFVRAALLNPKYLLLDEITSALDIQHIGKMLRFIKQLSENGTGILIATHLIGFASNAASQIVFLNDGKIIEQGDKTILKTPKTELFSKFLTYLEYAN